MLSSKDIRETKFSKAMGGYRQEEVDVLLDKVEADYEAYERSVRELQGTVESLRKEIENYKNSQNSIQSVLLSAQKLADQIVAEAKTKSEAIIREAQGSVERISREEKELSAAFEEKANTRKAEIERDLETTLKNADIKKRAVEDACEDAVRRQQVLFDKLRLEVVAFKTDIHKKYKEHLELLQRLPDEVPMDPKQIAEAVSAVIDKRPDPESFLSGGRQAEEYTVPQPAEQQNSPLRTDGSEDNGFHIAVPEPEKAEDENEEESV